MGGTPAAPPGMRVRTGRFESLRSGDSACSLAGPATRLLRPLLTSRSGLAPSGFHPRGEISPGKNALLHCTTAASTPPRLDHGSFAVHGPLAPLGSAFYPVLVHRLAASLHASSPHSVALVQLRFASFAVINLRRDLHPQECVCAGRTMKKGRPSGRPWLLLLAPLSTPRRDRGALRDRACRVRPVVSLHSQPARNLVFPRRPAPVHRAPA